MQIFPLSNTNSNKQSNSLRPKFGLIELKKKDFSLAQQLMKGIVASENLRQKNSFITDLYRLFEPYLNKEGELKAKKSYILEEVASELTLKFMEFINSVNKKATLEGLIQAIDDYQPNSDIIRPEYRQNEVPLYALRRDSREYLMNFMKNYRPLVPISAVSIDKCSSVHQNVSDLKTRPRAKFAIQAYFGEISEDKKEFITKFSELLEIPFDKALKLLLRNYPLFENKIETIDENIDEIAKLLIIERSRLIKAASIDPAFLNYKPETINSNLETLAKLLKSTKEQLIEPALKNPLLLYQLPATINENIEEIANMLNISKQESLEHAVKHPTTFSKTPSAIQTRFDLLRYYRQIQNKPDNVKALSCITRKTKDILNDFLSYLIKINGYSTYNRRTEIINHLPEILNQFKDSPCEITLPKNKVNPMIVEHMKECSKRAVGENVFVFKIKSSKQLKSKHSLGNAKEHMDIQTTGQNIEAGKQEINTENKNTYEYKKEFIINFSKMLGISYEKALKLLLRHYSLFEFEIETMEKNIDDAAKLLNVERSRLIKIASANPSFLCHKPKTLNKNAEASAKLLGITKDDFIIKMALKQPQLLYQKPKTLNNNAETSAKLLGITKEQFVKMSLKQPSLIFQKSETLNNKAETAAELLGITKEQFVKAALSQPQLLSQKPETLNNNAKTSAELLGITKKEFIEAALDQPQLFSQLPATINKNIEEGAKVLNISKKEYLQKVLKNPIMFSTDAGTIQTRLDLSRYYRQIQNKPDDVQKISSITKSTTSILNKIFAYIIKSNGYSTYKRRTDIINHLPEILGQFKDSPCEITLPENKVKPVIIEHMTKCSEKAVGKNVFEFKIAA